MALPSFFTETFLYLFTELFNDALEEDKSGLKLQ